MACNVLSAGNGSQRLEQRLLETNALSDSEHENDLTGRHFTMDDPKTVLLPRGLTVLQWTDEWFDELEDRWRNIPPDACGTWDDNSFPAHVFVRGCEIRFSEAVHHSVFQDRYGRPKPAPLTDRCPSHDRSQL